MKKEKLKENPMIGKQKRVKIKNRKFDVTEDTNEVKTFIIILAVIIIIVGVIYFVTEITKKDDNNPKESVTAGAVNYNKITVGTLLNRPYDNYYILVYDANDKNAVKYSTMMSNYTKNSNHKKIYFCDLSNTLNKDYYNVNNDDKSNPDAKTIDDLDFGNLTLIEIKNNEIIKYLEDYTTIHKLLQES